MSKAIDNLMKENQSLYRRLFDLQKENELLKKDIFDIRNNFVDLNRRIGSLERSNNMRSNVFGTIFGEYMNVVK